MKFFFDGEYEGVASLAMKGDTVAVGTDKDKVHILSLRDKKIVRTLNWNEGVIYGVAIEGDTLVTSASDKKICVWSISSGRMLAELSGHGSGVSCVAVQGDDVISGSYDKTVKVWSKTSERISRDLRGHSGIVHGVAIKGDLIVSCSSDKTIKIWYKSTGTLKQTLYGHTASVYDVAIRGDSIVSGSVDNTVKVWSLSTGENIKTFDAKDGKVLSVALNDKYVVAGTAGRVVNVWSLESGDLISSFNHHTDWVKAVAIEGNTLISGGEDKTVRVIELDKKTAFKPKKELAKDILEELKNPATDLQLLYTDNVPRYTEFGALSKDLKDRVRNDDYKDDPDNEFEFECPIIGSEIKDDTIVAVSKCNHVMSKEGFAGWKSTGKTTCPMCRQDPGEIKNLSVREMIVEKILRRWEDQINETRDRFFQTATNNMSVIAITKFAEENKDTIIFQDFKDKGDLASEEVFKWYMASRKVSGSTGSKVWTSACSKKIPPITIKRPLNV